jgi:hypothetical protein
MQAQLNKAFQQDTLAATHKKMQVGKGSEEAIGLAAVVLLN